MNISRVPASSQRAPDPSPVRKHDENARPWDTLSDLSQGVLQKAAHKNDLEIQAIYKKHFPEATSIVAPRERMEAKLKKIMGESNKNDLFNLLGVIGISLNKTPDISLKNLDYKDNRFNLTVLSSSYTSLDEFSQSLTTSAIAPIIKVCLSRNAKFNHQSFMSHPF